MRRALLLLLAPAALALGVGCEPDEPCQRYVDYMCDCHGDDTGFDCAELERTYEKVDSTVQNSCALELQDQRQEDEEDGLVCEL